MWLIETVSILRPFITASPVLLRMTIPTRISAIHSLTCCPLKGLSCKWLHNYPPQGSPNTSQQTCAATIEGPFVPASSLTALNQLLLKEIPLKCVPVKGDFWSEMHFCLELGFLMWSSGSVLYLLFSLVRSTFSCTVCLENSNLAVWERKQWE